MAPAHHDVHPDRTARPCLDGRRAAHADTANNPPDRVMGR